MCTLRTDHPRWGPRRLRHERGKRDLARLLADDGRPAWPTPLPRVRPELPPAVEVDRLVNVQGGVTVAGKQISVGSHLAGQRVRIRLDGILLHVIDEAGHLRRTLRGPLISAACARLRDGRLAGRPPPPDPDGVSVDRVVGIQGTIQVAGQKVRIGRVNARQVVRVLIEETTLTVYDGQAVIVAVPRLSTTDVNRLRAKHQVRPNNGPATHGGVALSEREGHALNGFRTQTVRNGV